MIIWLASYPRSGNTLLRTIIKTCTGGNTYSDEPIPEGVFKTGVKDNVGHIDFHEPWPEFYSKATQSQNVFLVKTHLPPIDKQPAIYVVREGRACAWSYYRFLQSYFAESKPSLVKVLCGEDYYGGWSDHVREWTVNHSAPKLVLHFENLVQADAATLQRIASFIRFEGTTLPWQNPLNELQKRDPQFFREGKTEWQPPAAWSPEIEQLFQIFHQDCQQELGYGSPSTEKPPPLLTELTTLISSLIDKKRVLEQICQERMTVIQQLDAEAKKRLTIIEAMHESPPT